MIRRNLAVISGFHTKVIDRLGPPLRSKGIDISFTDISNGINREYFDRLVNRTILVASRNISREDIRLRSILVSCITDHHEAGLEFDYFFPSMRRLSLPGNLQKDVAMSSVIANKISDVFKSKDYEQISEIALPHKEQRLLLPVKNAKLSKLTTHYQEIYEFRSSCLSRRLERDIARLKSGEGHCIKGTFFKGTVNDGTHPIRRCTDSPRCDLQAMMRFGVHLPERFEFDVSCESGLAGKTFFLCDGSAQKIPRRASHLNMRVNDDFLIGTKQ